MLRGNRIKIFLTLVFIAASVLPWYFSSNVLELIARQRDVLLGRYSFERFSNNLIFTLTFWLAAYVSWCLRRHRPKEVAFRIIALLLAVLVGTVAIDIIGRFLRSPRYIERQVENPTDWPVTLVAGIVRHRPPDQQYRVRYVDAPPTARSYLSAPPGYRTTEITLTIDHRGFRNLTQLEQYDIVTVGDSLTEGAYVSDDEPWPVLLGRRLNRTVYNLGVGGGEPNYYLNALQSFGLSLKPKIAIFMVYEGNDLRGKSPQREKAWSFDDWLENSPVRLAVRRSLIQYLGPINADAPVPGAAMLSWLPVAIPPGAEAKYYTFKTSMLMRLYWTESTFRQSSGWTGTAEIFRQIKAACARGGIRMIVAYAPTVPHVVMPLVKDRVTPEQLHVFASFKREKLPPPKEFVRELFSRLDTKESVLRDFFREEDIEFVSTTEALRKAAAQGRQIYYTYDQHWTAAGHVVVAEELYRYLTESNTPPLH